MALANEIEALKDFLAGFAGATGVRATPMQSGTSGGEVSSSYSDDAMAQAMREKPVARRVGANGPALPNSGGSGDSAGMFFSRTCVSQIQNITESKTCVGLAGRNLCQW